MQKKTFTKKDLAERIHIKLGYSKEEAKDFVNIFFETIIENLLKEKKIKISKLGTFDLLRKKQRVGRNPKTKEKAIISERNVVSLKFSKVLKEKINK